MTSWYTQRTENIPDRVEAIIQYVEIAQRWLLRGFVVVWVFFLGGCFASFLNVVAWRLPQGRGITGSSKCPFCNNKLSFTANLPVFGWLSSGGRCRSCKLPISPRYLWVEIILGLVFVTVVSLELFCGGFNLPLRPIDQEWGIEPTVLSPKFDLLQIVAFHLIAICLLFTLALVRLDGKQVPYSVFGFGVIVGLVFLAIWPAAQQVGWQTLEWGGSIKTTKFWLGPVLGLVAGLVSGLIVAVSHRNRSHQGVGYWRECLFGFSLIGLYFGVQFVMSVALIVLLVDALLAIVGDLQGPLFRTAPIFKAFTFTLILMLVWRNTSEFRFWPGPNSSVQQLGGCLAAMAALGLLTSLITLPQHPSMSDEDEVQDIV